MKRILGLMLAAAILLALFPVKALAAGTGTYCLDAGGTRREVTDYTVIDSTMKAWDGSANGCWYLATGNVHIDDTVWVYGEVNLILEDGASLKTGSIILSDGSSLTIYGQEGGTGVLDASGTRTNYPAIRNLSW